MENNTLTHHGIKGMKWGIRRFQNKDGSLTPAGKKRQRVENADENENKSETVNPKKKRLSELSDQELRDRINRLQLEKQYKELSKDTANYRRGKDFALRVIEKIGENTLTNIGTQAANKALGIAINKAFKKDPYDATHRIVNPNKGQIDKK